MDRQYWLLLHHSMTDRGLIGFEKTAHGSILEMSMDGEFFLWPLNPHGQVPDFNELCEVCTRFLSPANQPGTEVFRAGCLAGKGTGSPCAFDPAPEAEEHQDFENLLADGTYFTVDNGCRSISDFLRTHNIDPNAFLSLPIGTHSSIRACRLWLRENETLF